MDGLAVTGAREDREALFLKVAAQREDLSESVAEKDFWVCWTLSRIFELHDGERLPRITFKGGTTLSKVYGLIQRFSEDIDISLERSPLIENGELDPLDPERKGSLNNRANFAETLRKRASTLIGSAVIPLLERDFRDRLGAAPGDGWRVELAPTTTDPKQLTVLFHYPAAFESEGVSPLVRIEYGLGDQDPCEDHVIEPYAAELFPELFEVNRSCAVRVLHAARTFWEKTVALHEFYHQSLAKPIPGNRCSRHYYDVVRMAEKAEIEGWLDDHALREAVVWYKQVFFKSSKSGHDKAMPGSFQLVPHDSWADELRRDYASMCDVMIFGDAPAFPDLVREIEEIEGRVNSLSK